MFAVARSTKSEASVLETSVGSLARITYRALSRELERLTAKHGISAGQWPLLRELWEEEGLTQRELSYRVGVQEATMTVMLERMEKNGIVRRARSESDHRRRCVFLSAKGKKLRQILLPCIVFVNRTALADIPTDEIEVARRVLIAMNKNLSNS
jgi:DNA-binding MarR family transcriptional regulator